MNVVEIVWNWLCRKFRAKNAVQSEVMANNQNGIRPKTSGKMPDMLTALVDYLTSTYDFRYNQLTEETEYRKKGVPGSLFMPIGQRELNSFCMDARLEGINCWDRDLSRYINSDKIVEFHPFRLYMDELPEWDGKDRLTELAERVSKEKLWVTSFHRWMLGLAVQWMGTTDVHANSVVPILVSREQGRQKSTFCKVLVPDALQRYYTDSFDLSSPVQAERKLAVFGLINMDEFDKIAPVKTALLKNLIQMADLNLRKAYRRNFSFLPRVASFIGTSNRKDLLTDPTGSRRFLCVEVFHKIDCDQVEHTQIYAQLKAELRQGKRYWFTNEEEQLIMQSNAAFYRQLPEEEVFYSCYRPAERGEKCEMLSGADIFKCLKKFNAAAMREASPLKFTQVLIKVGVERVHTKCGNYYRVVPLVNPV